MNPLIRHAPLLPILVPLLAGTLLLLVPDARRALRVSLATTSTLIQMITAVGLLWLTSDAVPDIWSEGIGVYAIGNWPAPLGIVLVVDRLSALMLTLSATLSVAALVYSFARWDRVGVHYHALFQFLLMGLNGAFLTGDLFNLFVFFEVLLAASYGLLLHGSGAARVKSGLHYITVNLVASFAFLIGVATLYAVAGTLNMADLAARWPTLSASDRQLFEVGAAILGIAFLVKAGSWPLNFWLPTAYSSAGAPVAAMFSIMTKVGVYAILRVGSILGPADAPSPFGGPWLFYIAIATMLFGIAGMLASPHLGRLLAFSVILSTGTLLAAVGSGIVHMTAPALYYLLTSVLAAGAFFLVVGMTERVRTRVSELADEAPLPPVTYMAFRAGEPHPPDDEQEDGEVGIAIPAAMAVLGLCFICCVLLITGLPPLSGFIAKFALLTTALGPTAGGGGPSLDAWVLTALLLFSGLAGVTALTRVGIRLFWSRVARTTPRLRIMEVAPAMFLILLCTAMTVGAAPVMSFLQSTERMLGDPQLYIRSVLSSNGAVQSP